MSAMSVPGTIVHDTDGNLIFARVMVKSSCSPVDGRWTVTDNLRALVAADHVDQLVRRHAHGALAVDGSDHVAGLETGGFGRAVRDDRGDDRLAVLLAEQDADADDVLVQRVLLCLGLLGRQENGVASVAERLDHARGWRRMSGSWGSISARPTKFFWMTSSASQKRPKSIWRVGRCAGAGDACRLTGGRRGRSGTRRVPGSTQSTGRADRDAEDEDDREQQQGGDRTRWT